jgi:hypothetical protein
VSNEVIIIVIIFILNLFCAPYCSFIHIRHESCNPQQAHIIHHYKNTKKLFNTDAAMWFNKIWRFKKPAQLICMITVEVFVAVRFNNIAVSYLRMPELQKYVAAN